VLEDGFAIRCVTTPPTRCGAGVLGDSMIERKGLCHTVCHTFLFCSCSFPCAGFVYFSECLWGHVVFKGQVRGCFSLWMAKTNLVYYLSSQFELVCISPCWRASVSFPLRAPSSAFVLGVPAKRWQGVQQGGLSKWWQAIRAPMVSLVSCSHVSRDATMWLSKSLKRP